MTPHPFAALVRKLDAEASKAPWNKDRNVRIGAEYVYAIDAPSDAKCVFLGSVGSQGESNPANARAIVTLRNAAPDVAALVEAAWQALDTACDHAASMSGEAPLLLRKLVALRTALSALDAKAKETA